ncbi:MAG: hypothetical protein AB8H79_21915 [Myxococcota bacterium]
MRLLLLALPGIAMAAMCEVDEIGVGSGLITVHNDDSVTHEIVVSDNAKCVIGMRTELRPNTTRTFDIDENGAFFCVGGAGGTAVQNGQRYTVRGGAVGPE